MQSACGRGRGRGRARQSLNVVSGGRGRGFRFELGDEELNETIDKSTENSTDPSSLVVIESENTTEQIHCDDVSLSDSSVSESALMAMNLEVTAMNLKNTVEDPIDTDALFSECESLNSLSFQCSNSPPQSFAVSENVGLPSQMSEYDIDFELVHSFPGISKPATINSLSSEIEDYKDHVTLILDEEENKTLDTEQISDISEDDIDDVAIQSFYSRCEEQKGKSVPEDLKKAQFMEDNGRSAIRGRRICNDVVRTRPSNLLSKIGSMGTKTLVEANYFRVLKKPDWTIYQYRVDFSPDVDNTHIRRGLLSEHRQLLGGYIFDGTVLYCTKRLVSNKTDSPVLELTSKNRAGDFIIIRVRYVSKVENSDSQQFQVLNLILRRAMEGLRLQLVSRNFFDPKAKINLEHYNMQIWPGYQTSIRQHEHDILLCTEIAHKVMRTENLYHILTNIVTTSSQDIQSEFKKEVIGTIVLTDYNNKTYRIDDVDFSANPRSTFPMKDIDISYIDYYKRRYNITIRDHKQPLLISRSTEKKIRAGQDRLIILIPELTRATGMTDAMRNNFKLMKAMSEHTRLNPDRRIERLKAFNQRLQSSQDSTDVLNSWNMKLDTNLVEMAGRILPPQRILFGSQGHYVCDSRANWSFEFRKKSMYSHVDIRRWIVIAPSRVMREVQDFIKMCMKVAEGMKMTILEPKYEGIPDDRVGSYSVAINTASSSDPQMLMIVLMAPNEEKYSCIKKRTCVDRPVPSQVVTIKTIAPRGDKSTGLMSIATKVVIQMNAKLMGAPWMVEIPPKGLMTVGFDVCHSSKNKNKSFGAIVATMDMKISGRYFSAVMEHMKGQELSNEMAMYMTYAIKAYRETHSTLPERILFYRDGVGDGQLYQVFNSELTFLKKKLDDIYIAAGKTDGCRLAYVVVAKRINTRYFVQGRNPAPGTVVDDVITLPERYDFFLVSQSVRQGTVAPTSYNVLHDNMGLSADKLQMLTYKMTHMYYNYSGACRVPAVCQYAHKLAFLVAEHINRAPAPGLGNQLYFL